MPFPSNLTAIDRLTRPDHSYLEVSDRCGFLGEYFARRGFAASETNNLIINLKKPMCRCGNPPEWRYKLKAIDTAAAALRHAIHTQWMNSATFVPIPPSKAKAHPMHDDRLLKVLQKMNPDNPVDCRELIIQVESTDAAHLSIETRNPDFFYNIYEIDEACCDPAPEKIVIIDDVLTTGAHFKAAQRRLFERFDSIPIVGVFIARRAFPLQRQ